MNPPASSRALGFLSVLLLVAVGCGARVEPLNLAGPGVPGQPGLPGALPSGAAPGVNPTAPGALPSGSPTGGVLDGQGVSNCRGGASDTGVTATTIKLGMVIGLTGPLPGQFNSAFEAVDAHFRMVNANGGICGRLVQLIVEDDGQNGVQNKNKAKKLAEQDKVFAFVGSTSAPDDRGIGEVSKQHKIPDIGFLFSPTRNANLYSYGVPGISPKEVIGDGASGSKFLNAKFGIEQMAIWWLSDAAASYTAAWAFEAAMLKATGGKIRICHEQETTVLNPNFDQFVLNMAANCRPQDGPIAVYTTMENNANIRLAQAMRAQRFGYTLYSPTFTSYHPSFIREAEGATEGAYIAMPQIPFERCNQASDGRPRTPCGQPELDRYIGALGKYRNTYRAPGSFGGPGWGQAALFVQVATECGANLTRRCVLDKLNSMGRFSDRGFLSANRPGDHTVYRCDLIVQVKGGKFVELPKPAGRTGLPESPDIWNCSTPFNWWDYYCDHREQFPQGRHPQTPSKDQVIECD